MMSREHHRRRSPESSRRRRKERRQSRGQLQSQPMAVPPHETSFSQSSYQHPQQNQNQNQNQHQHQHAPAHPHSHQRPQPYPYQEPYNEPYLPEPSPPREREPGNRRDQARARGLSSSNSSTSISSSTSSSLLNISQPSRRFGLGVFFSGDGKKQRRRIRKKRSKFLRFGNSSSSSVGSDLAYGRGYIDRRRSRESSPPSGQRPPGADGATTQPRPPPKRAQTDEEIIELGRQFAELAKKQNAEDLRAAGKTRPSTLAGAVTALEKIRRSNSGNVNRGAGNSKLRLDSSSDDSEWESAQSDDDESSEGDSDNSLAYGSHHLLSSSGGSSQFSASAQTAQTYSQNIPLNRKRSLVDPKLFGPVNSLRGFVRSPCGFERVDRSAFGDVRPRHEPLVASSEAFVSAKDAPLQHVHPVATSDPSNFGVDRDSIVSARQDSTPRLPRDSVPIQQPKPRAPAYAKVIDSVDAHLEYSKPQPGARAAGSTAVRGYRDASTSTIASSDAAIGTLLRAAQRGEDIKYQETRANDSNRQPKPSRDDSHSGSYKSVDSAASLRDAPSNETHEQERKAASDVKKERGRRQSKGYAPDNDSKKQSSQRDRHHDDLERIEAVERLKRDLEDSQGLVRGGIQRGKSSDTQYIVDKFKDDVPAPASVVEPPKGAIDPFDPFQYQDPPTPRYGTPTRPLAPVIKTVEREPDFSDMGSSERWSLEDLLQDKQKAREATEQITVPVGTATPVEAVAAKMAEQQHEGSFEHDTGSQDHSRQPSPPPQSSRDPVLDDADRAYRKTRRARRIREEEERSRSNSPNRSVVDKWKDEKDAETSPEPASPQVEDRPKPKSPYDGPDADVRIDNVLEHPKELIRFRFSESQPRSLTFPVFSARDPSAERERPMLNLVRPTPAPSPGPGKQQLEDFYVPSPSVGADVSTDASPVSSRDDESTFSAPPLSKAVSWGENETKHYVVESPEREDDPYSGTKVVIPAETNTSRIGKKKARSAIAAAIGIGAAIASMSESTVDQNAAREYIESEDIPQVSKKRPSLQFDPSDGGPPVPGPKPLSLRGSRVSNQFVEDPAFMANVAAALEGSGFDPNIVINDEKFHRRDSPPGSNESFGSSGAPTDREAWNPNRDSIEYRSATVEDGSSDSSQPTSTSNRKNRRKRERAVKQETSGNSVSAGDYDIAPDPVRSDSEDSWENWSVATGRSRKPKSPTVIQHDLQGYQQAENVMPSATTSSVNMSRDLEDLKAAEPKLSAHDVDANSLPTAWDTRQIVDNFSAPLPEVPTAINKGKEKAEGVRGISAADELPPSSFTLPSELPHENSFQVVDVEANPASFDAFDFYKGKKEPVLRSLDAQREIPKANIADSVGDVPREVPPAAEEEWEDLPETPKKKKKKPKRGATAHRGHSLRSTPKSVPLAEISDESTNKSSNEAVFAGSPSGSAETGQKAERRTHRAAPGEFPVEEDFSDRGRLPNTELGQTELRDNKESTSSSFFDLFKSSIGLREGKEQSRTQDGAESFLDNAGALDASAGWTGAAIIPRSQKSPERATGAPLEKGLIWESRTAERIRTPSPETEFIDPEIVEREIRPAIDPTYGDLLPLPPSRTSTPAPALNDDIPPLPESRPGTPEDEREKLLLSQKSTHVRRRSDIPLRVKTPSHSAIPIQFRLAQRTTPVSPSILKVSSSPSPVAATPETGSASKARARPMSWESTRAFKPLLLVERTSREVAVPPTSLKEELLPSSIPDETSNESRDALQEDHPTRAIARGMESPKLPPLKPIEEPESPTPRPDPVDPVSKNRSSFLLYSSPSSSQDAKDADVFAESPTLSIAKRHAALNALEGNRSRDISEDDLPKPTPAGLITDAQVATAVVDDHVDSQEARDVLFATKDKITSDIIPSRDRNEEDLSKPSPVSSITDAQVATAVVDDHADSQEAREVLFATKDKSTLDVIPSAESVQFGELIGTKEKGVTSDIIPSGESAHFGEVINTKEKGLGDEQPAYAVLDLDDKPTENQQEANQTRELEPFVEAPGIEASADPEVLLSSGAPESSEKPTEKEDDAVSVKTSKKGKKKKKKRQSQKASPDDSEAVEAPIPVEEQDKLLGAVAAPAMVEAKPDDGDTETFVGVHTDTPFDAHVEAPRDSLVEAHDNSPVEAPVERHVDTIVATPVDPVVGAYVDTPVETHVDALVDAPVDAFVETPVNPLVEAHVDTPVEAPVDALIGTPVDTVVEAPVNPLVKAHIDTPVEAPVDALVKPHVDALVEPHVDAHAAALPEAPTGEAVDVAIEAFPIAPADIAVKSLSETSVEHTAEDPIEAPVESAPDVAMEVSLEPHVRAPVESPVQGSTDVTAEPSTEASFETPTELALEIPAEFSTQDPDDIEAEPLNEAPVSGTVEARQGAGLGNTQAKSSTRLSNLFGGMASRMFSGTLGIRAPRQTEAPKADDRAVREEEHKRREASIEDTIDDVDDDLTSAPIDTVIPPLSEASVEPAVQDTFDDVDDDLTTAPTDLVIATSREASVEPAIQDPMEAPFKAAPDVEVEAPPEVPADIDVESPIRASTDAAVDIAFEGATEDPIESSFDLPTEAFPQVSENIPVESSTSEALDVAVEAPTDTFADVPIEAITEGSVEGAIEAPTQGSIEEDPGDAIQAPTETRDNIAVEAPTEAFADVPVEAPIEASTEATLDVAVEAPTKVLADIALEPLPQASVERAVEAPMEAPIEVPVEFSPEGPAEVFVDAPVTEPPALEEPVPTVEKADKEERNTLDQETKAEEQSLSLIQDGDHLGETVINERALVEDPTSAHEETTLERNASANAPAVSPILPEEPQTNIGRETISQDTKEESADVSFPEATTPPEFPPPNTGSETVYPIVADTLELESEQAQGLPIDVPRPSTTEEGTADEPVPAAATDVERPVVASKKSKKKKKGKASQSKKLEPETLVADDSNIDTGVTEQANQVEDKLPSLEISNEGESAAEAISSEQIPTPGADNLFDTVAEVVEPTADQTPTQAEEKPTQTSETQQPPDAVREFAAIKTQIPSEDSGVDRNENEEKLPIQSGEPNPASVEGDSASVSEPTWTSDADQLRQEPNPTSDREVRQGPEPTDAVENQPAENIIEDLHTTPTQSSDAVQRSDPSLDLIDEAQDLPSDQPSGEIPTTLPNLSEEPQGKKKGKKNKKKKKSLSALPDAQEGVAESQKIESAEEHPVVGALSPEQIITSSPAIDNIEADSKHAAQPTDDATLDAGSPSEESSKGKHETNESGASAPEDVVESSKLEGEVALDNQVIGGSSDSTATTQVEPTNDNSAEEYTIPEKTGEEEEKKDPQSVDLIAPTEDVSESPVTARPSITEDSVDAIQQETEPTLPSTEAELQPEKGVPGTAQDTEATSEENKQSSAQLDPSSGDNFAEITDSSAVQQDRSPAPELPEESTALTQPAAEGTEPVTTEVLNTMDDSSLSNEIKDESHHRLGQSENEDTSNSGVPPSESLPDLTEVPAISEQVNEDDRVVSSASTGAKKTKKSKKKKRQSVQFAEPLAESTEIAPESTSEIAAVESTSELNKLSPDTDNEPTTPIELARSPSDAPSSHDQSHDEPGLQDLVESYPVESSPSSIPLPAAEEPSISVPQTVPSQEDVSGLESIGPSVVEPEIDSKLQDDIDTPINAQLQDESEETHSLLAQTEPIESDVTADAPGKKDDSVLSDNQQLAEAIPVPEDHASASAKELLSVPQTSEPEKSLENQESASDLPALAATADESSPLRESQETASSIPTYEAEVPQSESVPREDQGAIEQAALDNGISEKATVTKKKGKKKGKKSSKAQEAASPVPLPNTSLSSAVEGEGKSQDNIADAPRPVGEEYSLGVPETSDTLKPETDDQSPPPDVPAITSPLTVDDGDQPSQDAQIGDSAIVQPDNGIEVITDAAIDAPTMEETVIPLPIVPESPIKAQPSEELTSEPAEGLKSEIDEKRETQDDQLLMDQANATRSIETEPVSDIAAPASVIEQTTTEPFVETVEDQAVLTEPETHTQEPESQAENESSSVAVATPVNIDASTDVPAPSETVSEQLPIPDEAIVEDVERPSAQKSKKDKKKKKKKLAKSEDNEPSLLEPAAQSSATSESKDTTVPDVSSSKSESPEDNAVEAAATNQIEQDKENAPADSRDEEVPLTSSAEPAHIEHDSKDMGDAMLPPLPDSTSSDAQPQLVDTLQAQEPANDGNTFDSEPPAPSQEVKEIQELASPSDENAVPTPQQELEHAASDAAEQNSVAPSVEVESFSAAEVPKADDSAEISSPGPSKKTKDKKKKKKKSTSLQEKVSLEKDNTLAESLLDETQQSGPVVTDPAEAPGGDDTTVENVLQNADRTAVETSLQVDTPLQEVEAPLQVEIETPPQVNSNPQDDGIPSHDDTFRFEDPTPNASAPEESIAPKDGDTPQNEATPQDDAVPQQVDTPASDNPTQVDTGLQSQTTPHDQSLDHFGSDVTGTERETEISGGSTSENGLPKTIANGPNEDATIDLGQSAKNEQQVQEPPIDESIAAPDPTPAAPRKSKKDKKKKKQLSPDTDKLPEDKATEDSALTISSDTGKHAEDNTLVSTPQFLNEDDPGNSILEKENEKDNGKDNIPLEDQTPAEQPSEDSARIASNDMVDPSIAEPATPELAAPEPAASEPAASEPAAPEPAAPEPEPEPSNNDSPAQPPSTKKTKKSKKKKKQSAALEDEELQLTLSKDEVVTKEDLLQKPLEAQSTEQEPPQDHSTAVELPKEIISEAEPTNEDPPRDAAQEVSEVVQDIPAPSETVQAILPQEREANASSEPTTVLELGESANDKATELDISPVDSFPEPTPTKKSKKGKGKKKLGSSSDADAITRESPQLEESQPVGPTDIGGPIAAAIVDDTKEEDVTNLAPAETGNDNETTKQELPEDLSQTPVEAPEDSIVPDIPGSIEQTEANALPPDVSGETEATGPQPATTGKASEDKTTETPREDETLPPLQSGQQPGVSGDASAEAPQSESPPEVTSSKGSKKSKKKKRASAGALKTEPGVLAEDNTESLTGALQTAEPTEISSSSLVEEKSSAPITEDQNVASIDSRAISQDEVTDPDGHLEVNIQASEPISVENSIKIDDAGDPGVELKLGETPTTVALEAATQEPLSEGQQPMAQATDNESRQEVALEAGLDIAGENAPSSSQGPETLQSGATPKVDIETDSVPSRKSKKDKKKKKRASQVSWELEPEAEIEDLPEQQQPQQAFDEQPMMTNEPADMGSSGEAVQDPFSEFASGKIISEQNEQRQSQTDWELEPKSEITAGEPEPSAPSQSQQGQHHGVLLDHQSPAEDTQTSLKDSINLDDTLLKTTSSKKSKRKNKASQSDWNVEPAPPVALAPTEGPLPAEPNIIDEHFEPVVDAPPAEATETVPEDEANPKNISRAILSAQQPTEDNSETETQFDTKTPEVQISTGQPVETTTTASDEASKKPAHLEDVYDHLDASNEQLGNFPPEKFEPPLDQAQSTETLNQGRSAGHNTSVLDMVPYTEAESSYQIASDDQDAQLLPAEPEEILNEVAVEKQAEAREDTTAATIVDLPHEVAEFPTPEPIKEEEAEEVPATSASASDANLKEISGANLQSWDWSNIENETQPEILNVESVAENSSQLETGEPSSPDHTTSEQEQKQLHDDDVARSVPTLDEAKAQTQSDPGSNRESEPEHEHHETYIARRNSIKDTGKWQGTSLSESEPVPDTQSPQPRHLEADGNPQDAAAPELIAAETKESPVDEWPSLQSNEAETDNAQHGAISAEENPHESSGTSRTSREPVVPEHPTSEVESHATTRQDLPVVSEVAESQQTIAAGSTISPDPADVPNITEAGQSEIVIPRTQDLSSNHRVSTSIDMSPAQLSSHIEHERPFDQSTQPDKKVRIELAEDDTMMPEPLSAMTTEPLEPILEVSDAQTADAPTTTVPLESAEQAEQKSDNSGMPGHAADDNVLASGESDAIKRDDFRSFPDRLESQDFGFAQKGDKPASPESLTTTSDGNKEQIPQIDEDQNINPEEIVSPVASDIPVVAGTLGASENEKGEEESIHVDQMTAQHDNVSGDPSNFRTSSNTDAELPSEPARDLTTNEQMREFTSYQDPSANDADAESPVMGRGEVLGTSRRFDADRIISQKEEKSGTAKEQQDGWDALDTSEQPEDDADTPLHVDATEASKEPFLPSLPPPRTPSALDFSRSLPPVEEETHEDLEKELQSDLQVKKTRIGLEASRDSGIVADSPSPQRRNLDIDNDEGQRDSGVHMLDTSPIDASSGSSQTPQQPHERRSRRSLFDSETPKLSTPTQSRGWDRGATPEKPVEDEPLKRTVTPLKPRTPFQTQRSVSDNVNVNVSAGAGASSQSRDVTPAAESAARRSASNTSISRLRTPESSLAFRPDSPGSPSIRSVQSIRSLRSAGANTPPLRSRRMAGGNLRSLSHSSHTDHSSHPSHSNVDVSTVSTRDRDGDPDKDKDKDPDRDRDTARGEASDRHALHTNTTPIANEGRVRSKDMPDVYDGYGEGRIGSPRSPTRPPSMRRRQSMQVMELEARVEQLLAENRALADARVHSERNLNQRNTSAITDRDAEIESLKASLKWLQNEVTRLTEVNEGLQSANGLLAIQHNEKYTRLESKHTTAARELEEYRGARDRFTQSLQAKDAEIQELRNQLEATKEQIREMKKQILAAKPPDADFLRLRDEDHFDHRCQQLCSHVQQWVLRFSKFSDMRACRLTKEINDEKIIDRLDNSILDGSDVDEYLKDRVARRDIFMSMTMNMIWEFVFTRYLFGMDREQRQKLKSLEKLLTDVGPPHAVRQWRAITLTLLSKRPAFGDQRNQDTEAVVQAILQTLSMILPPPSNLEAQIQSQLRRVMREAVDLSIEMRTQRAEYMMLPPLQPEYDANGELTQTVAFKAALMDERSGDSSMSNEAYEAQGAVVRCVLFPLVVKKGNDNGVGDEEIVVSPAQVLVAKARRPTIRMVTPSSDAGGVSLSRGASPSTYAQSSVSMNMQDAPPTPEYP